MLPEEKIPTKDAFLFFVCASDTMSAFCLRICGSVLSTCALPSRVLIVYIIYTLLHIIDSYIRVRFCFQCNWWQTDFWLASPIHSYVLLLFPSVMLRNIINYHFFLLWISVRVHVHVLALLCVRACHVDPHCLAYIGMIEIIYWECKWHLESYGWLRIRIYLGRSDERKCCMTYENKYCGSRFSVQVAEGASHDQEESMARRIMNSVIILCKLYNFTHHMHHSCKPMIRCCIFQHIKSNEGENNMPNSARTARKQSSARFRTIIAMLWCNKQECIINMIRSYHNTST